MQQLPPNFKVISTPQAQQQGGPIYSGIDTNEQQKTEIAAATNQRNEREEARDARSDALTNQVTELNVRAARNDIEADESELRTAEAGLRNGADAIQRTLGILKGIRTDATDNASSPGLGETGTSGQVMRGIPLWSNAAKDMSGKIVGVKGLNAFSALKDLASQNVKLTPISNAEIDLAAASVANLDPELSQEEFLGQVDQAIAFHQGAYDKIMLGLGGGQGGEMGADILTKALKAGRSREEILALAAQNNLSVNEEELDANLRSRDAGGPTSDVLPPDIEEMMRAADAAMQKYGGQ
jgi:hypothetical protein